MKLSCKTYKVCKAYGDVKTLLALCFVCFALYSQGQLNKEFIKKNFKDNVKGYKNAIDSIRKGDTYYNKGIHYYRYAIPYYLSAEKFNPDNATLNYKIGKCMIYSPMKNQAATYLEKAIELNSVIVANAHYYLARAYHLNMDWDKAKEEYNTYLQTLTPDKSAEITEIRRKIEECDNGKQLSQSPVRVYVDNLAATINNNYPEYHPLISADETEIIYTSRIPAISKKIKIDPKDG